MPNVKKLKERGSWGSLQSCIPPITCPAWHCYSTGKNPGKLGLFWWESLDWQNRRLYYPENRKLNSKEIWDYISEAGKRVGVMGVPLTYPPKRVNGFLISGQPDAQDRGFTYPESLEEELVEKYNWKHHPERAIDAGRESDRFVQEIYQVIETEFKVANILLRRYDTDFFQVTNFYINILQHFLWDDEKVLKAWQMIDKEIGELLSLGQNLILMSDHGSNRMNLIFNINTWLEKEGYLSLNRGRVKLVQFLGRIEQRLSDLLAWLRILSLVTRLAPQKLIQAIPSSSGEITGEQKIGNIDWQKSKAIASGQGPVYLNPNNSQENKVLKEELVERLEALVDPKTGYKVVEKVYAREEIYSGKFLNEAPDLIMDQAKGIHITGGIGKKDIFELPGGKWTAENKRTGWFMAYGQDIKSKGRIGDISILDLAPTILHMFDLPVPSDMDGRVLKEVFREDSELARREIEYQEISEERERIDDKIRRLKKLGKL